MAQIKRSLNKYPQELKDRAVRMVFETIEEQNGERYGVVGRVARQLGVPKESLRNWFKQAETDGGKRPGTTTEDRKRIVELEKENRELRLSNEILRTAASFFAAELDRPSKR